MMNFQCKIASKGPIRRELTITVLPEVIREEIERGLATRQKSAKLNGFRVGKVPIGMVRKHFLQDVKSDVFSKLVRESYLKALDDNKLTAVGSPQIQAKSGAELKEGEDLVFTAEVEIFPEIELKDLGKIKVKRPSDEVSEKDIQERIDSLRENQAEIVPDEVAAGPAKQGDHAEISFRGTVDGKELDVLTAQNRMIHIGGRTFMEDFESGVVGMKKGETKEIKVSFPADFSEKNLAGNTAIFEVTLHEFKKKVVPELDDDFAKRFKLDSALELRKKISEGMREEKEREAKEQLKELVLKEVASLHPFEVPQAMTDSQLEYLLRENAMFLKRQGFTEKMIRDYIEKNQESLRAKAQEQVRVSLILDRISEEQGIRVEPADLDYEFDQMATRVNAPVEEVRKIYESDPQALRQLKFRLKETRAIEHILGQVKIQ